MSKSKCIYKDRKGAFGEVIARSFLEGMGWKFIKANYRFERSEIDIIFEIEQVKLLIFVEVKTRSSKKFGEPESSILSSKQAHIRKAAEGFVMTHPEYEKHDMRIDVVTVMFENETSVINHIENAF
ncbi:YraN family protein [soil metagenome]